MRIKATIWDFGRVLLIPKGVDPYEIIANELGVPLEKIKPLFIGELNQRVDLGEISIEEYYQAILDSLGLPHEKVTLFESIFSDALGINEQLITYIRELKKEYRTALLSNYHGSLRAKLQTLWNIEAAFDEIIISAEVGLLKPYPAIYRLVLSRLGLKPQETIFVDDREEFLNGAAQLGIHPVLFKDTQQTIGEVNMLLKQF